MTDSAIRRLTEYLKKQGWTAQQILDLIEYITK